jgi:heme/copper-type cytochrome/quinol oxidase subunit 2
MEEVDWMHFIVFMLLTALVLSSIITFLVCFIKFRNQFATGNQVNPANVKFDGFQMTEQGLVR